MKNTLLLIVGIILNLTFLAQSSCGSPLSIGTPTSTETCQTLSTAGGGSSPCAGSGYGGPGGFIYVNFCTNSNADCINFTFNNQTTAGNWAVTIYDASCLFIGQGDCMGSNGSGASFNTSEFNLTANTCYTARIWVKTPGDFEMCVQAMNPSLDDCNGALPISSTPQASNNICTTPGPTTNTPTITPADICAGSLENTAWYSFTTLNTGDVVVTIDNITCSGGAAGFQIGYFVGSCGSLTNIGCQSGSGGTVTATITGLIAGDEVYIAIDGNAGANCEYDISATNTIPLPVGLAYFKGSKYKDYNDLEWLTMSEINNDYFTIEKSLDGQNWGELITIKGSGDSYHSNRYNYRDYNQVEGIVYYRLFQKDYNGSIEYLGLVALYTEPKDDIKLIKVVNFIGQEINPDIYNGPKLYIYENGMVVKKR
jgi:hypothetical protein